MVVVTGVLKEEIVGVFRELLPLPENGELLGRNYSRGIIGGNEVTTIYGFIGKVESALMTQAIIDRFHPKYIVHCGSAGSIDPNLKIGDIVCGTVYYEHDFHTEKPIAFYASSILIERIKDVYPYVNLGCIVSGDVIIDDRELKENIYRKYGALAADMDSAAMAKVCHENSVDFCSLKVIVDTSEEQTQTEYEQNFRKFASLPSAIVSEMLDKHLL